MDVLIKIKDREGVIHEAPTDMAMNIMELCKAYELPVEGTCGMAMCASVNVMSLMTLLCLKWEMMKRQCSQRHSMSSRTVV
jgi:hypothetical protein